MKIAYHLPDYCLTNSELASLFPLWDYENFEKKVGIKQRYVVAEKETALDLAEQAALKCLGEFDKSKIDFVLFCTQSPDYFLPTTACVLQSRLKLSNNCGALDYNLGCSGFVYGLSLAKGLLMGGIANNLLLVVAETYSKHIHPEDRSNRSIFGDAAAATILTKKDISKICKFVLRTDGDGYDKLIVKNGGARVPYNSNAELLEYGSGNRYTDNNLYMDGPDIFSFTIEKVPQLVEDTLNKNNIAMEKVDYFIFHQANQYMLNFLRKSLKIPKGKFCIDMENTGNTVSSTIPIALSNSINKGVVKTGDKIMLVGFGVGLSWGAVIITL